MSLRNMPCFTYRWCLKYILQNLIFALNIKAKNLSNKIHIKISKAFILFITLKCLKLLLKHTYIDYNRYWSETLFVKYAHSLETIHFSPFRLVFALIAIVWIPPNTSCDDSMIFFRYFRISLKAKFLIWTNNVCKKALAIIIIMVKSYLVQLLFCGWLASLWLATAYFFFYYFVFFCFDCYR